MKTRIISGIVMGVIVACVLALGFLVQPIIITLAVALIAAGAVYELIHNAAGIKSKIAVSGSIVFAFLYVVFSDNSVFIKPYYSLWLSPELVNSLLLIYFLFAVIIILKSHKDFDLGKIVSLFALPLPYAYAFSCLSSVIKHPDGIYYLLLLLNFSSVCDMGAYFVGVTMGKHKLCPNLSPKKTVEGAVGGIVSSIIVTVIISLCFAKSLVIPMILTIPFCVLGMLGDLFASAIKRSVGLKDYSNLIPGHGGILDRVDSIIMIAPFLYFAIYYLGVL